MEMTAPTAAAAIAIVVIERKYQSRMLVSFCLFCLAEFSLPYPQPRCGIGGVYLRAGYVITGADHLQAEPRREPYMNVLLLQRVPGNLSVCKSPRVVPG